MALTVSESSAVFDLLHWLGVHPLGERLVDDDRAAAALALLADHAAKTLQIAVQPGEAREAIERLAARLAGADLPRCRVCGCTDDQACAGGCWWVADDLCSACEARATPAQLEGQLTIGDVK